MLRYELKYAVSHLDRSAIVASILMHPSSFTKAFPDRKVNNIYMDTPAFHCYHQNVEGAPRRSKMRLRWYGDSLLPTDGSVLEIKNKDKELGWKKSFAISTKIDNKKALQEAIKNAGLFQGDLIPVLNNAYQRSYYVSSDKKFRITVDTAQSFNLPFSTTPKLETKVYPTIIELKYDKEHAETANEITAYLPYRQSKNSKYTTGVEELYL